MKIGGELNIKKWALKFSLAILVWLCGDLYGAFVLGFNGDFTLVMLYGFVVGAVSVKILEF